MKRSSLVCLLFLVLFSFGYRFNISDSGDVSRIYLHGTTLIRTTPGTGIRLYDLSNPAAPRERGSIAITQNVDVAVKDRYMYADKGKDLVVFDISDLSRAVAVDTIRNVFNSAYEWMPIDEPIGAVEVGNSGCNSCSEQSPVMAESGGTNDAGSGGKGGSLSRFAVVGEYLYCLDNQTLHVYDVSDPARPRYRNKVSVAWDIETLFPYQDKLFIGGRSGMYIYNAADQEQPVYLSEFQHRRSCDPVVVEDGRAYVTLRGGNACNGFENQLDIIDIGNIRSPKLLASYQLAGPYGLSVRDGIVLVCDGTAGLKILDVKDAKNVKQIGGVKNVVAHDIILDGNMMILSAEDKFYLYDVTDIASPVLYTQLAF